LPLPEFLRPEIAIDGAVLSARHIVKSFGGIKAVQGIDISVRDRTLHALIGPTAPARPRVQPDVRHVPAGRGPSSLMGQPIAGTCAGGDRARGHRPLVPDHQSVSRR
jgi:branched-chain amino acid transport system ATP-binding protein